MKSFISSLSNISVIRKGIWAPFFFLNRALWPILPSSVIKLRPVLIYGKLLHALVRSRPRLRNQNFWTYFMRNRPELELIRRIASRAPSDQLFRVTVIACSKGAEVFSLKLILNERLPHHKTELHAIDISSEIIDFAKNGAYDLNAPQLERLSNQEKLQFFDRTGNFLCIKKEIREGIHWHTTDACSQDLLALLPPQDVVMANRFLCHMYPKDAERCLINVSKLVRPGGYLFVSGIDLCIRTKVAKEFGWQPVTELIEQIHEGDYTLRRGWPIEYYGLEPLDKNDSSWQLKFASVFRMPDDHV